MRLPTINSLLPILFDDVVCRLFLWRSGVFYRSWPCRICGDDIQGDFESGQFRCMKRSCSTKLTIRAHTFFNGSKLKCCQIMHLGYLWLNRNSQTQVTDSYFIIQAMNETGCSSNTVTAFYSHFRSLVSTTLSDEDTRIGGPGVFVQIDETKLGKRKYHRGHRVEGVWILVGVELTEARRVFLHRVQDRKAATLEAIIQDHVEPGSIVQTDLWRGYSGIETNLGLIHQTVNHSKCFADPATGVNTNTVEGTNNALKIQIRPRNRTSQVDEHLSEFIWRRKNVDRLWDAFIDALKDVHYDLE